MTIVVVAGAAMILGRLLDIRFIGLVMANGAAHRGPCHAMVAGEMTSDTTDDGAFDASRGVSGGG